MSPDWTNYLRHILAEADYLDSASDGLSRERFHSDPTLRRAFARSLEIIGEASTNLPDDIRRRYSEVPWRLIIDMRNRLIHGYAVVDDDLVWNAVRVEVPALRAHVERMIDDATPNPEGE